MRNLGGAVGLAAIDTMTTARMALHRLHLDEQVTWARPAAARAIDAMTAALAPRLARAPGWRRCGRWRGWSSARR